MTNSTLINPSYGTTWIWWAMAAFMASILGATMLTRRVVEPLSTLSNYARNFGRGVMPASLPEDSGPEEIREVNSSFNRMVQDITRMEKDREMLLAGVSHDLRTPITRLRLETEMADLPEDTRRNMVSDLEQMENDRQPVPSPTPAAATQPLGARRPRQRPCGRRHVTAPRLASDPDRQDSRATSIADDVIVRCAPARALPRRAEPHHERAALRQERRRHPASDNAGDAGKGHGCAHRERRGPGPGHESGRPPDAAL